MPPIKLGDPDWFYGPVRVLGLRKLLPQGEIYEHRQAGDFVIGQRRRTLVQVYTDPGGMRTLAAGDIWGVDPGKNRLPWGYELDDETE